MSKSTAENGSADADLTAIEDALGTLLRSGALERFHALLDTRLGIRIDPSAYLVLRRIAEEGAIRPSVLARTLRVEPPTVSRHLRRVEAAGWVVRRDDPSDRRASLVDLTSSGRAVVAAIESARRTFLGGILGRWTPEERSQFAALVARFAADAVGESRPA